MDHGTEIAASHRRAGKASTWGMLVAMEPGWPNLVRRRVANPVVRKRLAGSNPVPGASFYREKELGSNPEGSTTGLF